MNKNQIVKRRIFVVDDEPGMLKIATILLESDGYAVMTDTDAERALEKMKADPPDLIMLDICMPGMNGLDACREIKRNPKIGHVPVMFASVRSDEADVVAGLELGAEDYVQKPLRERELLARVRSVFRRREGEQKPAKLTSGPIEIDFSSYKCWIDGALVDLTPKQFELLAVFVQNEGKVLTRGTISQSVWGADFTKLSRTIDTTVDQVRRKLGSHRNFIKSLKGVGYRYEVDEE